MFPIIKDLCIFLFQKVIFVFHMIFKLDLMMQTIYCVIHRCLYSLFILLFNPALFIHCMNKVAKVQQYEWKKKPGVTRVWMLNIQLGKLFVLFCNFFWNHFTVWFMQHLKILICCILIKVFSQQPQNIFQPFISIGTASNGSYKILLNKLWEPKK